MRNRVGAVAFVFALIAACTSADRGTAGSSCAEADECASKMCTSDGYCGQDCTNGQACPSGWSCAKDSAIQSAIGSIFGQSPKSSCVPGCNACPAGLSCTNSAFCTKPTATTTQPDAGPTCTKQPGEVCDGFNDVCCGGACGLRRSNGMTCALACPGACTLPSWSCHSFAATRLTGKPAGDFCLPNLPTVTVTASTDHAKVFDEVTLTATGVSPAGAPIVSYRWTDQNDLDVGTETGPVYKATLYNKGTTIIRVRARDEAEQFSDPADVSIDVTQ